MASHSKTKRGAAKTICIQIAVAPAEHKALQNAAIRDGRSLRQYVKWSALKASGYVSAQNAD